MTCYQLPQTYHNYTRAFNSSVVFHRIGVPNQLSQECNPPYSTDGVPRVYGRHNNNDNWTTTLQSRSNSEGSFSTTDLKVHTDKNTSTRHWDASGYQTSSTSGSPPFSSLAEPENSSTAPSPSHLPIMGTPLQEA